jgi:hypothetical protein
MMMWGIEVKEEIGGNDFLGTLNNRVNMLAHIN